jgi:hypothetical protein
MNSTIVDVPSARGLRLLPVLVLCCVVMLGSIPMVARAGFGVSPSLLQEDNLVPGASLQRTFYLVQGNPVGDLKVEILVESEKAANWFTIVGATDNTLTIPGETQQFPVTVQIDVPDDAELGVYKAHVRANTLPASGDGQVTIALAARTTFNLVVGDDVIAEYSIDEVAIPDLHPSDAPRAELTIRNTGNVSSGPDAATFELFNKFGDLRLAYAQLDGTIPEVAAFTEERVTAAFPLDIQIGVGEYWGHVKVYDDDVLVKELKTVFEVREDVEPRNSNKAEEAVASALSTMSTSSFNGIPTVALVAGGMLAGVVLALMLYALVRRFARKRSPVVASTPSSSRPNGHATVVRKRK